VDRKNSLPPRDKKKIGPGGIRPTFFCNDSEKDRVSGERSKGYAFARAVMLQVFRTK
jgi:hypothetical protein